MCANSWPLVVILCEWKWCLKHGSSVNSSSNRNYSLRLNFKVNKTAKMIAVTRSETNSTHLMNHSSILVNQAYFYGRFIFYGFEITDYVNMTLNSSSLLAQSFNKRTSKSKIGIEKIQNHENSGWVLKIHGNLNWICPKYAQKAFEGGSLSWILKSKSPSSKFQHEKLVAWQTASSNTFP